MVEEPATALPVERRQSRCTECVKPGLMQRVRKVHLRAWKNAKKCADENKGYSVFDSNGNKVYPASANTGTSCNYVVKITVDGLRYRDNPGTSGTKVLGYLKKNYKYTVVEERTVNGVKWGKLKSGAGWFSLQSEYSVRC